MEEGATPLSCSKWHNIVAFWLLGLTNNYLYTIVVLSAALDIIHGLERDNLNSTDVSLYYNDSCTAYFNVSTNATSYKPRNFCQRQGTSVVLLAAIVPTLLVSITAPYWMFFIPYWIRVFGVVAISTGGSMLVALSQVEGWVLLGAALSSVSSGFGEVTFLSLTAFYHKSTISGWSAGTGAAGITSALVYAGLKTFLSSRITLFIQVYIPLTTLVVYFLLLGPPTPPAPSQPPSPVQEAESNEGVATEGVATEEVGENGHISPLECNHDVTASHPLLPMAPNSHPTLQAPKSGLVRKRRKGFDIRKMQLFNSDEAKHWLLHVKYIPHLFKYLLPLFILYFSQYAINQGFFELLYNPNTHLGSYCLDQFTQYRWLQVTFQIGSFLMRTSAGIFYTKYFWILSLLQLVNFVFFFVASVYLFLPSFWLTLFLVLYEGLLGGVVYINTLFAITKEVPEVHREFSMGVVTIANWVGITLAGVASIFIHKYICSHFIGYVNT